MATHPADIDATALARAIAEAVRADPSLIDEFGSCGVPVDLLRATPPQSALSSPFSDQAVAIYARMDDGSSFLAIIDPEPDE